MTEEFPKFLELNSHNNIMVEKLNFFCGTAFGLFLHLYFWKENFVMDTPLIRQSLDLNTSTFIHMDPDVPPVFHHRPFQTYSKVIRNSPNIFD